MVIELAIMSHVIIAYEKENFTLAKPGITKLIEL